MTRMQWARLQADVNCALRRGAWYRVTSVAGLEAVVDINRQPHPVPSYLLQIVSTPPRRWTVVPRPREAARLSRHLGAEYAVCPSCRERTPLRSGGRPRAISCARCRGVFEVAWNEGYLSS
jgi:hypothetical protein